MFTGEEPYGDHDSYNTFVKAVCTDNERPVLPEDMHPSVKNLLELCWHREPEKRPSFSQIIDMLDDAMVDCTLSDPLAITLWKENWKGKDETSFNKFVAALYKILEVPLGRDRERNTDYKCLKAILSENEKDTENSNVNIEKLGLLLKWFGPLQQTIKNEETNIISIVGNVMKESWFHGDLPRPQCEALLTDYIKKKGTYLVRLSTTDPIEKSPFTISKVNKKGKINHQRVFVSRNRQGYYIVVKSKSDQKDKKLEAKGEISNLIAKVAGELDLKTPCPGRKYGEIFQTNKVEGYLPSPDDDSTSDNGDDSD
jgi:hypothetical protein